MVQARARGAVLGRPTVLTAAQERRIFTARLQGRSFGSLAKEYGVSRSTIQRVEQRVRRLARKDEETIVN
jgi:putative DNA-invertase from lambdoid prophage Rac